MLILISHLIQLPYLTEEAALEKGLGDAVVEINDGQNVKFHCKTTCSYPPPDITWEWDKGLEKVNLINLMSLSIIYIG